MRLPRYSAPMVLRKFEDRLERMVEGVFARAFRTGLQPVEIARRLVKDLDANRTLDVRGRNVGPNHFVVRLATDDHERFAQVSDSLVAELRAALREHAEEEELRFLGPVIVELTVDDALTVGTFRTDVAYDESASGQPLAFIELPDGRTIDLPVAVIAIGRLPESGIVLSDPNASRQHAELRPDGDTFELVDLGSTNGSRVNGIAVDRHHLRNGDELTFGSATMRFRLH